MPGPPPKIANPSVGTLVPANEPTMPTGMSALARAEWKRIVPELMKAGVLTRLDSQVLRLYCEAYADWITAKKTVKKEGRIYQMPNGMKRPHPAVAQCNAAERRMNGFLQQLACTPLARTRIRLEPVTPDDPMDEFIS
jgi:P27 family predicted phage terminase small subunit